MLSKNSKVWIVIFLIVLAGNIFVRFLPIQMPSLKARAEAQILDDTRKETIKELQKDYAFITPVLRHKMVEAIVEEKKHEPAVREKVSRLYSELKADYQDQQGRFYLAETDSYAWMRAVRQVLERGYPGTEIRFGKAYDSFILAPQGRQQAQEQFLFYSSAFLYRLAVLIAGNLSLETFLFYLPVFFSLMLLVCVYLFCCRFFTRRSAVLAVFFIGFAPIVVVRSSVGWFDSDIMNVFFPLVIIWSIAKSLETKETAGNIIFSLLAGLLLGLFCWTWVGWWFIFLIMQAFFIYYFLNTVLLNRQQGVWLLKGTQALALSCGVFSLSAIIFCLLFTGREPFSAMISSISDNLGLGKSLGRSIWPEVYSLVMELQPGSRLHLAKALGGHFVLTLGAASALLAYVYYRRKDKNLVVLPLLFWFFCMFTIALRAQRFGFFVAVPIGIFLSLGLEQVWEFVFRRLRQEKPALRLGITSCIILLVLGLCFSLASQSLYHAQRKLPLLNDAFASVYVRLGQETPPESIINTLWDYGNWIKEIARRRVLFDPQSQNRPIAYWFSRALLDDDEETAVRILRMLNNSSDKLFEKVNAHLNNPFKTIVLLVRLVRGDSQQADRVLAQYQLPEALVHELKESVFFKRPAAAYLVLTNDMLNKIQAISYLANWDFAKVFIVQNKNKPRQEVLNGLEEIFFLAPEQAQALYKQTHYFLSLGNEDAVVSEKWTISPFIAKGEQKGSLVYFDNGLLLDLENLQTSIFSFFEGKYKHLKYTRCLNQSEVMEKEHKEYDIEAQGLCVKDESGWRSLGVLPAQLSKSLLVRLAFIRQDAAKYFEPLLIDDQKGVYVYKINWEQKTWMK